MGVYRSRARDLTLAERLADAAIGTVIGVLLAVLLWIATGVWWAQAGW